MTRESGAEIKAEDDRGCGFGLVSSRKSVIGVALAFKRVPEAAVCLVD
jgi:hypothetical protein